LYCEIPTFLDFLLENLFRAFLAIVHNFNLLSSGVGQSGGEV
jgi:hypothetical protein